MDWGYILSVMVTSAFGVEAIVFGLAAIGVNMQFGYTGLLNFGQSAFMAVGGYSVAVTVVELGLNFWVGVVLGLVIAVFLALLLGVPTLRLRADYLAIVTIAASEIVRLLVRSVTFKEFFGGSDGQQNFAGGFFAMSPLSDELALRIGPVVLNNRQIFVLIVGWGLVFLGCLLVWLLVRSPWGRVLKGIREDEDAVRSLGKNVYLYKMQSLIIGGLFGAIAGFVYAVGQEAVQPGLLRHGHHLLRLRHRDPGRCRQGVRAGARHRHLLGRHPGHRRLPALRHRHRRPRHLPHVRHAGSRGPLHARGAWHHAPDDLPTTGNPRRSKGVGTRCPIARRHRQPQGRRGSRACRRRPHPGAAKPDPILIADDVTRRFGGLTAVDVEHVEIQRGAITALIGPTAPARPPSSTC